ARLSLGVKEVIAFSQEKLGKKPVKVFLGGGGSVSLDAKKFSEEVGVSAVSGEELLKAYPIKITASFGQTSKLGFMTLFGLALLTRQKSPLNFVS
ncbi:MAG: hypothetical protein WED08_03070, partial [Patescibacteria group bacterium]